MRCTECVESGVASKVYDCGATRTCMGGGGPYWDEEGVRHQHDSNTTTTGFRCSQGHMWVTKSMQACPAPGCPYGGEEAL
jgi:hypothetical protein